MGIKIGQNMPYWYGQIPLHFMTRPCLVMIRNFLCIPKYTVLNLLIETIPIVLVPDMCPSCSWRFHHHFGMIMVHLSTNQLLKCSRHFLSTCNHSCYVTSWVHPQCHLNLKATLLILLLLNPLTALLTYMCTS